MFFHKISFQNSDLLIFRSYYYIARKARGLARKSPKKISKSPKLKKPEGSKPEARKARKNPARPSTICNLYFVLIRFSDFVLFWFSEGTSDLEITFFVILLAKKVLQGKVFLQIQSCSENK